METVMKIHETEDDGDVLAFLTGQVSSHDLSPLDKVLGIR